MGWLAQVARQGGSGGLLGGVAGKVGQGGLLGRGGVGLMTGVVRQGVAGSGFRWVAAEFAEWVGLGCCWVEWEGMGWYGT